MEYRLWKPVPGCYDPNPRVGSNCTPIVGPISTPITTIHTASELARSFAPAVRARNINALTVWMERASQATSPREMNGFAAGLTGHWLEVKAAVELPWSNGRTEGHVNRLKLIKRKMFGRGKLDLLRIRVMASGP